MMSVAREVIAEIERMHEFFVGWFNGAHPKEDALLERELVAHIDAEFVIVQPGGVVSTLGTIAGAIGAAHGTNDAFRIQVRNVKVRWVHANVLCATYEEWQRNATASTPANNARIATVLFLRTPDGLMWLHVHETWLPPDVMAADAYDF
jgi:hypothetical protein